MKLEHLIEVYLNATATAAEEAELRQRLQQGEPLPAELEPLRPLVCANQTTLPPSLQPDAILATPDESAAFESVIKARRRRHNLWIVSLTASVAAVVAVVVTFFTGKEEIEKTQSNPSYVAQTAPASAPQSTAEAETGEECAPANKPCAPTHSSSAASSQSHPCAANAKAWRASAHHHTLALAERAKPTAEVESKPSELATAATAPTAAQKETIKKPLNEEGEASEHIETRINRHRHIGSVNPEGLVAMQ